MAISSRDTTDSVLHEGSTLPNEHLVARLVGIQNALMAQHTAGMGMPTASAGDERELLLRVFLGEVFPSHFRFSTGAITDSTGEISGQVDIAIEYPFLPSFPMPATRQRLLLAESVAVVVEVKSDLSKQWSEVEATTEKVRQLSRRLRGVVSRRDNRISINEPIPEAIPCIAVGYQGYRTLDGLRRRLDSTDPSCRPDCACVISGGLFVGLGAALTGPVALYAMCIAISKYMSLVASANADLVSYVTIPRSSRADS